MCTAKNGAPKTPPAIPKLTGGAGIQQLPVRKVGYQVPIPTPPKKEK